MPQLFVSYSRDDGALIEFIVDNLRQLGFDLWIDIDYLEPGTAEWQSSIDAALRGSEGVLAFLSPTAFESKWCNIETRRAQTFNKPIYPVMVAGDSATSVPIQLEGVHYADMRGRANRSEEFERLVGKLAKELNFEVPDFSLRSDHHGAPIVQVNVTGNVEGNIIAIGWEGAGEAYVAGGDIIQDHVQRQTSAVVAPQAASAPAARKRTDLIGWVLAGVLALILLSAGAIAIFGSRPAATQSAPPAEREAGEPALDSAPETQAVTTEAPTTESAATPGSDSQPLVLPDVSDVPSVNQNAKWTPRIETIGGVQMALVPPGCFPMGSDDDDVDEGPVHGVCFESPFWIDVYEVTNQQYGEDGCFTGPDLPRTCVSWYAAVEHCESRGARLPTEAEWEYAARGPDGLIYPWGNTFLIANVVYFDYYPDGPEPVGSVPGGASWVGALDMAGNVWEWVNDTYVEDYYATLPAGVVNPQGPDALTPDIRMERGGAWNVDRHGLRLTDRTGRGARNPADVRASGFRCALSASP